LEKEGEWIYEIGEPPKLFNPNKDLLSENINNPIFIQQDNKDSFVFRIRNIHYPKDVYQVSIENKKEIAIRTTNKKYFKRFEIPAIKRKGLELEPAFLSFEYNNNTLIVKYKKPSIILKQEEDLRKERVEIFSKTPLQL